MATYTTYLNLEKPTTSETFNLLKMNQNWDKIDAGVSALNSNLISKSMLFEVNLGTVTTDQSGYFELPSDYATPWSYRPLSFWNNNGGNDVNTYTCIGHRQNKTLIKVTDDLGNIIASTNLTNTHVLLMKLN